MEWKEKCICGNDMIIIKEPKEGNMYLELLCEFCGKRKVIFDILEYQKQNG